MTAGCPNRQRRHTPSSWTTPNPDTTLLGLYFQQPARAPRAARSSLKSSSSTHATSLYGARCCGGVCAPAGATPPSPCPRHEDRLVGQNERALSLPESHTRRISAPSRNSWQGGAILPLYELGDQAMWIVMYVAMIASLSAMGMLPVAEYRDQLPHDDA